MLQDGFGCGSGSFSEGAEGFAGKLIDRVLVFHRWIPFGFGGEHLRGQVAIFPFYFGLGRRILGAGELDEEAGAGHVACDGFFNEGAGDAVGLIIEDDVDGAAKALAAPAGRELAAAALGRGWLLKGRFPATGWGS